MEGIDVLLSPLTLKGIMIAFLCGGVIGLERRLSGKAAGIRTSILICAGSYAFVALSTALSHNESTDDTRVLGQVITGIGFLGAGVMLNRGKKVKGVTTGAVIWVLAGIGSYIGFCKYSAAISMAIFTVFVLFFLGKLEYYISKWLATREKKAELDDDD